MKMNKIFKTLFGVALPIFAIASTLSIADKKDDSDNHLWELNKVNLYDVKYPNKDYLNEPEKELTFKTNFMPMGIGETAEDATIWDNYRGDGVTVAIIDTGIDLYHEDFLKPEAKGVNLTEKNIEQYSIIDKRSAYIYSEKLGTDPKVFTEVGILKAYDSSYYNPHSDNYVSHGTCCAGCIGAMINGVGGWGLAPNVNLLIIKSDLSLAATKVAIKYAVDCGADVVSMSFGIFAEPVEGYQHLEMVDGYYDEVSKYAHDHGTVLVAAAGNESTSVKSYPASVPGIIGVGALEKYSKNRFSTFTNYNNELKDTPYTNNNVDVMAPGYAWVATAPTSAPRTSETSMTSDHDYREIAGTSFATPLTAAAVALYKGKNPTATVDEITKALYYTSEDIGYPGWDSVFGYGRVDVPSLLKDNISADSVKNEKDIVNLVGTSDNPYPSYKPNLSFTPSTASTANKKGEWKSSNPKVAYVNVDTGIINALSNGSAEITFTSFIDNVTTTYTVNVTNVTTFDESLVVTPQVANKRIRLNETTKLGTDIPSPFRYEVSKTDILSADENGIITPHKIGSSYIRFYIGDKKIGSIEVFVVPDYDLIDLEIKYDNNSYAITKFYEKNKVSGYKAIAHYNNSHTSQEVSIYIDGLDNHAIGLQKCKAIYEEHGITITKELKIWGTFENAIPEKQKVEQIQITTNFDKNRYFTGNNTTVQTDYFPWMSWRIEVEANDADNLYYGFDEGSGSIIGNNTVHANAVRLICDSAWYISPSAISFNFSINIGAKISCKIGETSYLVEGKDEYINDDFFSYLTFEGNGATGPIVITISDITEELDLINLGIDYPEQLIDVWNKDDQAKAMYNVVSKYSSCASNWDNETRNTIPLLVNEFNMMKQDAKDHEIINDVVYLDKGNYETTTMNKLKMIVSEYNKTLKEGETKLVLILRDANNNAPALTFTGDLDITLTGNYITLYVTLGIVFASLSASMIFAYRRKQK